MTSSSERFALDPRLAEGSRPLLDWPLSHLRLKDDARFPWILLIPRRPDIVELTDLAQPDYDQLAAEIRTATALVLTEARPDKVNVATIGNLVPQLHVHVIGRFRSDAGWPRPVWCLPPGDPYAPDSMAALVERYATAAKAALPGL
jgi:diadenosine tetraphosphate (Ap4A) HIT family hydrolase